jgi:hypothetical protein
MDKRTQYGKHRASPQTKMSKIKQASRELDSFIEGDTVNITKASEFSKMQWGIYSQLVTDHFRQTSTDRYHLSGYLLQSTRDWLDVLNKKKNVYITQGYRAADIVVMALCRAAQSIGAPTVEPDDSSDYWLEGKPIWGADRPISEAWAECGQLIVPEDVEESLKLNSDTRDWAIGPYRLGAEIHDPTVKKTSASGDSFFLTEPGPAPDYTDPSVVRISRIFEKQKNFLPKLTIEVEGAPVCLLIKAFYSQVEGKSAPKEAKNLWNSIRRRLDVSMAFKRAKAGRPLKHQGRLAALLHYRDRLPWSKVSLKLCSQEHTHNLHCQENYRKQAEQYWKKLRKKAHIAKKGK